MLVVFLVLIQTQRDLSEVFEHQSQPGDTIQVKVNSRVRVRTLPNTSIFSREIRKREAGEIVNVLELTVNNARSLWVREKDGSSAIVHGNVGYMAEN